MDRPVRSSHKQLGDEGTSKHAGGNERSRRILQESVRIVETNVSSDEATAHAEIAGHSAQGSQENRGQHHAGAGQDAGGCRGRRHERTT